MIKNILAGIGAITLSTFVVTVIYVLSARKQIISEEDDNYNV